MRFTRSAVAWLRLIASSHRERSVSQVMPVVSVVVPCWNGGRFLDGLLDSLAAQTFRDFETIVVDDGSTEADTLGKLAALDGSIRVIRQENRGLPAARNAGFEAAAGELVLPLDCDDRIEPGFLAETVAALEAAPEAGFAFTHAWLQGLRSGALARHSNEFDQLFLNQLPYCMLIRKKSLGRCWAVTTRACGAATKTGSSTFG